MTPFPSPEPFRSLFYHGDAGAGVSRARTGNKWSGGMRRGPGFGNASGETDHSLPVRMACQAPFVFNAQHPHKIVFL